MGNKSKIVAFLRLFDRLFPMLRDVSQIPFHDLVELKESQLEKWEMLQDMLVLLLDKPIMFETLFTSETCENLPEDVDLIVLSVIDWDKNLSHAALPVLLSICGIDADSAFYVTGMYHDEETGKDVPSIHAVWKYEDDCEAELDEDDDDL